MHIVHVLCCIEGKIYCMLLRNNHTCPSPDADVQLSGICPIDHVLLIIAAHCATKCVQLQ